MMKMANVMVVLGALALGPAACEKKPDEAEIHKDLGRDHLDKQEWAQAIAEYELSLKADPNQEEVWKQKAVAHMKAGEKEKAAEAFAKTADFRKEPAKKAEVFRNLAGMFMQSNDLDKAETYFNEAVKHDPKDDQSYSWLAEIYAQRGGARANEAPAQPPHLEKAIEYYDKAIGANPGAANNYINKRIVYVKLTQYEQNQKDAAEAEGRAAAKDAAKAAELKAKADKHGARVEELKKLMDEAMKKYDEAQKGGAPK
ncbi:MAG TPA: tetratricopeptide repeat protein [Polyangiaceae bacterium]|nr:tetratricopeptide repeat protein [Polyangiaceae bacterium]